MGILDGILQVLESIYAQLVNIPLDNVWSYMYIILNGFLLLWASLL